MKYLFIALTVLCCFSLQAKDNSGGFFIQNKGQWTQEFDYKSNINGGALFFTKNSIVYNLYDEHQVEEIHHETHDDPKAYATKVNFHAFKFNFINAQTTSIEGEKRKKYYQNYYIGNDKSKWKSNVPTFEKIRYKEIYNGIDLAYFLEKNSLKYEFYVSPGAQPNEIKLELEGATATINHQGDLIVKTSLGNKKELKPYCYQIINGTKVEVRSKFVLVNNVLSFSLPDGYDTQKELIIDPVLIFATYSGGTGMTFGWSAAYDQLGKLFSGGESFGAGWPVTMGSFQQAFGGSVDVGVNSYNLTGTALDYSSYLGGGGSDLPSSMICNSNDELIIAGTSTSSNFPTTASCYDNTQNGGTDLFVTVFDQGGTALLGSTYIGGSGSEGSNELEVNVDVTNNIFVSSVTTSTNFPTTAGAYQTAAQGFQDAVVLKMDSNCVNLLASTYLGGSNADRGLGVLIKSSGEVIACGSTSSSNFPTTAGALLTAQQGGMDGFVTILNPNFSTLVASTYIGTSGVDDSYRVQIDGSNNVYVCGRTNSATYPVSPGVYSNAGGPIYIDQLNPTLSASLSSTVIGAGSLRPTAFLLDVCGNVYVSSQGASAGLPLTPDAQNSTPGGFWIAVLTPGYGSLLYGTYMGSGGDHIDGGGSRFDPQGIIYQSVCTSSPATYNSAGAWSPSNQASSWDIASFKMEFGYSSISADFTALPGDTACAGEPLELRNVSTLANTTYDWDFGDGSTDTGQVVNHTYLQAGTYTIRLIAENIGLCLSKDTAYRTILILDRIKPILSANDFTVCSDDPIELDLTISNFNSDMNISWSPATAIISGGNTAQPTVNLNLATNYTATVIYDIGLGYCMDTSSTTININVGDTTNMSVSPEDSTVCFGQAADLKAFGGATYSWNPAVDFTDPTQSGVTITAFSPKTYEVTISDIYGCSVTRNIFIDVEKADADAGRDKVVKYGQGEYLDGSNSQGSSIFWDPDPTLENPNSLTPLIYPMNNHVYYINAITNIGCTDRDSVRVKISNATIPNAFSPNGDQKNDVFRIIWATRDVKVVTFDIFNRWGQKVFSTRDLDGAWDGTFKGTPCDIGTYFYNITVNIGDENYSFKGDINLIR
jgi:gliding motility-associated-like protein